MELNNSQYQAIMRIYEQRQFTGRDKQNKRYQEVCEKLPTYPQIEESITVLSVQHGKKILNGDESSLDLYKKDLELLRKLKKETLVSGGFAANYLDAIYDCPDCKDTGYINNNKCHCFKNATIGLLYEQSNLKEILKQENFEHFSYEYYSKNYIEQRTGQSSREIIKEAVNTCKNFIHSFANTFQNLYIYGNIGVGKTFLLNCLAKELMDQEYSVLYFSAAEFFDILVKSAFDKKDLDTTNLRELIFNCDLLMIDDLGTEFVNQATTAQLFTCINERLLSKKSIVISSNLSPKDLSKLYNERILSRIANTYDVLRIIGDDIRLQKKWKD
ncbi:MAG: ATP-binding protein [Lachnospiraceae bacterium]|nr:ATP-binding protein [Lachnospiraceae bacterium]